MRCRINCLEPAPLEPPGWDGPDPEPWSVKRSKHKKDISFIDLFLCKFEIIYNKHNPPMANCSIFFTSALAPLTGESIFRFFLGPIAASAVRLASLCLIWASSCCCIWNTSNKTQISLADKLNHNNSQRKHILTSLAFCLSLSCSGSSCRDRDCSNVEDILIFQDVKMLNSFNQLFYSFTHTVRRSVM